MRPRKAEASYRSPASARRHGWGQRGKRTVSLGYFSRAFSNITLGASQSFLSEARACSYSCSPAILMRKRRASSLAQMSVPLTRNSGTGSVEFLEIFFSVLNAPCQSRAKRARSSSAACVERQRTGGANVERLTEAASTFIRDAHMLPAPGVSPHNNAGCCRSLRSVPQPWRPHLPPWRRALRVCTLWRR